MLLNFFPGCPGDEFLPTMYNIQVENDPNGTSAMNGNSTFLSACQRLSLASKYPPRPPPPRISHSSKMRTLQLAFAFSNRRRREGSLSMELEMMWSALLLQRRFSRQEWRSQPRKERTRLRENNDNSQWLTSRMLVRAWGFHQEDSEPIVCSVQFRL